MCPKQCASALGDSVSRILTHTDTHRHTQTHTDTHTDTHTYTQTHTQTHVHTGCHTSMRHNLQAVMISLRTLAATFFSSHACCSATAVKKSTFARHTVSHSLGNWSVCFQHRHKDDEAAVRSRVCAMTQQHAVAEEVRGWASGVDVQGKAPPSTAGSSAYQAIQTLRAGPQFPCTLSPHMPPLGSAPAAPASCSPSHKPQQAEMHVCVCEGGRERERVCVCVSVCVSVCVIRCVGVYASSCVHVLSSVVRIEGWEECHTHVGMQTCAMQSGRH